MTALCPSAGPGMRGGGQQGEGRAGGGSGLLSLPPRGLPACALALHGRCHAFGDCGRVSLHLDLSEHLLSALYPSRLCVSK